MKCLILAGGKGDRLWPLSRSHYPKQFIRVKQNHSLFQETIARNIPFCDEFIIVTNAEYRYIVEDQMRSFQGIAYRCVYEEVGRKTTAAIAIACMQLPLSETVFLVPADQLIEGESYKDAILRGKELARDGYLVTFGIEIEKIDDRFGYIQYRDETVLHFYEKPDTSTVCDYLKQGDCLLNSGMFLFQVGTLLLELKRYSPDVFDACQTAYKNRERKSGNMLLSQQTLMQVPAVPIEKTVFEKTDKARVVQAFFNWQDIGELEDVLKLDMHTVNTGSQIQNECKDVMIINECKRRLVVADGVSDTMIVNTKDAVYVGKRGDSQGLKSIIADNPRLASYFEDGREAYRSWGTYELLVDEPHYRVKKIMIREGKTIYSHKHIYRNECWTIVEGEAKITLDGVSGSYHAGDCINIEKGMVHQVSNIGSVPLHVIEVSIGENVTEDDMISVQSPDLTEQELGYEVEPFVKLSPAFKDYLWGGDRLKQIYGKQSDLDIVAESWELSAHEAGQSVVASGRHKGMNFASYLELIGKDHWGWKCQSLPNFPLLIKFIDARDSLSVQVHPDDDYALENENEYGKNEMWYVVDCEEGAGIYCGFNREVSREEVAKRIADNTILEVLNWIPAKKGDVFFIKAGTVHAIGKGMLICEIQQSSNCTYRLYDFDRRDKFGNLRQLHLEQALDVLDYSAFDPDEMQKNAKAEGEILPGQVGYGASLLGRCKYFECFSYDIESQQTISLDENSFCAYICIRGDATLSRDGYEISLRAGECAFAPMNAGTVDVTGVCELLVIHV